MNLKHGISRTDCFAIMQIYKNSYWQQTTYNDNKLFAEKTLNSGYILKICKSDRRERTTAPKPYNQKHYSSQTHIEYNYVLTTSDDNTTTI